jgi:hypothetical protein
MCIFWFVTSVQKEIFGILGCYTELIVSLLLTFLDSVLVLSSEVKHSYWTA